MARNQLATIGAILADDTRAEVLCVLLDGRAYTGGELARHIGVAASTMSGHLAKLFDAGMTTVTPQGRHRYWSLASPDVAELLEHLTNTSAIAAPPAPRVPHALLYARSCYDHLAGEIAVGIYAHLKANRYLADVDSQVTLTDSGAEFLGSLGVDVSEAQSSQRPTARSCLDWTQRRPHLSGAIGAALFDALLANKWIARGRQPRSIRITPDGRESLAAAFAV